MSKTPQNMDESLNSLLSPINILVTRGNIGNQGSPMMDLQCPEVSPTDNEKTHQNIAELLNSLLSPINLMVARGNNW